MTESLKATFTVDSWDEEPVQEHDGASKLTKAVVTKTYAGDIEGTSTTEWLMAYAPDDTATFVGMERIVGSFGGRSGSVVLQHVGRFADGAATAELTVASGSGAEAIEGASGGGSFRADPAGTVTLDLDVPG